ncbi:MAG: hypothetical protein JW795_05455 [Chitinivibrionales bacterium]|nr:hypothetical protein [Chitinivibrionales bacterium]
MPYFLALAFFAGAFLALAFFAGAFFALAFFAGAFFTAAFFAGAFFLVTAFAATTSQPPLRKIGNETSMANRYCQEATTFRRLLIILDGDAYNLHVLFVVSYFFRFNDMLL